MPGGRSFAIAHFIYVPFVITLGVVVGWMLGARNTKSELNRLRERLEQQERDAAAKRLGNKG